MVYVTSKNGLMLITNNPNACGDNDDEDGEDLTASYDSDGDDNQNSEGFGAWM